VPARKGRNVCALLGKWWDNKIHMDLSKRNIVLFSDKLADNDEAVYFEMMQLQNVFLRIETLHQFCIANEIIDVNNYKIIKTPSKIQPIIVLNKMRPFMFINCKN
jgi:hypothetical protein